MKAMKTVMKKVAAPDAPAMEKKAMKVVKEVDETVGGVEISEDSFKGHDSRKEKTTENDAQRVKQHDSMHTLALMECLMARMKTTQVVFGFSMWQLLKELFASLQNKEFQYGMVPRNQKERILLTQLADQVIRASMSTKGPSIMMTATTGICVDCERYLWPPESRGYCGWCGNTVCRECWYDHQWYCARIRRNEMIIDGLVQLARIRQQTVEFLLSESKKMGAKMLPRGIDWQWQKTMVKRVTRCSRSSSCPGHG